jgi:hypothetical protein
MNFQIDLAGLHDDAAIRRLLATNAISGRITLTYDREPNYFAGCETIGRSCQVLVARADDQIAGVACRATRPMFVNGRILKTGYLGQLRVDARFRGRWLISQGFRFLKRLDDEDPVSAYLLSVIEENQEAFKVLIERRRPGFPVFREVGHLFTLALKLRRANADGAAPRHITSAVRDELPEIIAFLQRCGATRQFYPSYSEDDFCGNGTRDFRLADFFVARRRGEIVGVTGLWDQSSFKQTVVRGYAGWLRMARPAYNFAAGVSAHPPLPSVGEKISSAYASFVCVADDSPEVFRPLLARVYEEAARRGFSYLMVGFDKRDPLLRVAQSYSHIIYPSRIFIAGWDDQCHHFERFYEQLDKRIPYFEIAAL